MAYRAGLGVVSLGLVDWVSLGVRQWFRGVFLLSVSRAKAFGWPRCFMYSE